MKNLTTRDTLHRLVKFAMAAGISLPLCFELSSLIRMLPYADRGR